MRYGTLLWHRLTRFYKENLKGANDLLKQWNLSNAQIDIISRLGEKGILTQQELAEKLLVTKGNVTQLLSRLEKENLIQREREWKTNYVSLTEDGEKLYREIRPQLEMYQAEQFGKLTKEEQKQLLFLLRKLQK